MLQTIEEAFGPESADMVECMGFCELAPNVEADDRIYHECRSKNIVARINNHEGKEIKKLTIEDLRLDDDLL